MTAPINLNKARKARAASAARVKAVENRVRFGLDKATKAAARKEAERLRRALDQARRGEDGT